MISLYDFCKFYNLKIKTWTESYGLDNASEFIVYRFYDPVTNCYYQKAMDRQVLSDINVFSAHVEMMIKDVFREMRLDLSPSDRIEYSKGVFKWK